MFHTRGSMIIHEIIAWFIPWFHVLVGYVNVEHECLSKETTRGTMRVYAWYSEVVVELYRI